MKPGVRPRESLLDVRERLTPVDHQRHQRYTFHVPPRCGELRIRVRYAPKFLPRDDSARLAGQAVQAQASSLAARVGDSLAAAWRAEMEAILSIARVPNLLTISLDDAAGAYRGAGHRHAARQDLHMGLEAASPGLVAGPLPAGVWALTLSAHTLMTPQCDVSIQIGAETAST